MTNFFLTIFLINICCTKSCFKNYLMTKFGNKSSSKKYLMINFLLTNPPYFSYVGDCQIPIACDMFIEHKGRELLEKNLYKNFILHMSSLFDFGLISPENFYATVQKIQVSSNRTTSLSCIPYQLHRSVLRKF